MTLPSSATGQPTLGRYTLVREIARSNDIVWEGLDPQMNRRVAVKELALAPTLTGQARRDRIERFYREARAAGAMNHPNIVTIHEVGEDHGRYFIAMEYLEGQTLRDRLTIGGALPLTEAIAITVALCDALDYAHLRGVIHRDIKPDNVHLLPGGRAKLTDFGIARITNEEQLTVAGQIFGTPSYMAPEQIEGRKVDARTDLFSLGIMLFEMVTGHKPFVGDSLPTLLHGLLNTPTPPSGASPAIDAVIQRATAKSPDHRFNSASEMRAALLAAAASRTGTQMPAYPPSAQPSVYGAPQQQSTAQYGTQTQFGVAPGYAASAQGGPPLTANPPVFYPNVPAAAAPPGPYAEGGGGSRAERVATLVAAVLFFGGVIVLGGGWALKKALATAQAQQTLISDSKALNDAQQQYQANQYEEAARRALLLRNSSKNDKIVSDATKTEAYSYLALGMEARRNGKFDDAAKWYDMARNLLPDDPAVKDHIAQFEQAAKVQNSNLPAAPATPDPTPQHTVEWPKRAAPGTPNVNASDFNNSNSANASQAQQLYMQGNDMESKGDLDGARRKWNEALQAGPGSQAAIWAQQKLSQHPYEFN